MYMTYRELEERKRLNRKYYEGVEREKGLKGLSVSPRVMLFYRLCALFTIGSIIGFAIAMIRHF